jgi:RES domain-containing protein
VWRQCPPDRQLLDLVSPARFAGRYHRRASPGVWYAALSERAAWAELFRHQTSEELSPLEILRRVSRARVRGLRVLDLTDAAVLATIGIARAALVSNDLRRCQAIAEWAQREGYEGILAPSAALDGEVILAVFAPALSKVTEEHSRVQRPPRRMRPVLSRIPRA